MGKDALGRDTTTDMCGNEHKVDAAGPFQQGVLGGRTERGALGQTYGVDPMGRRISDNSHSSPWRSGSSGGESRHRYGIIGGASGYGYSDGFPTRQTLSVIALFAIIGVFALIFRGVWYLTGTTLAQIGLTGTVNTAISLLIFMFTFGVLSYILIRHRKLIMLTILGGFTIVLIIAFIVFLKQPDPYPYNSADTPATISAPSAPHTQPSTGERTSSGQEERASSALLAHPTVAELNLRPEPRVGSGTLAVLYPEDTVTVLNEESEDGDWVKVQFGEQMGWVSNAYLNYE